MYRVRAARGSNIGDTVYSNFVGIIVYPEIPVLEDTAICPGVRINLLPSTGGIWNFSNPLSPDTGFVKFLYNNTVVEGVKAGAATLTFTDTNHCSANVIITVKNFPEVSDIIGKHVVCKDASIELTNYSTIPVDGGWYWRKNNDKIEFESESEKENSVKVKGIKEGNSFVSYTVSDGICETRTTFRIKVIPDTPPTIIIGFEK
jgi:hypothetical protein